MRACVQRVHKADVTVDGEIVGQIDTGMVVLLGVAQGDTQDDVHQMSDKLAELRIFEDDAGKMNRSLLDCGGQMLVVSQFTLLGDCRKGRRPSFVAAGDPQLAKQLYDNFVVAVAAKGIKVATGIFRAHMDVSLVNDGPVTLLLDSRKLF
ncbi:MAG: D-aminoacyl-tRNA deacylase [Pirellulaceae bacterium]|nr:D-aminoacyl-tRNA deacylase [Pirellulaceae bacterium]